MGALPGSEDPIAGLFDLADRVAEAGPRIRRMYLAIAGVIFVLLGIVVALLFLALRGSDGFIALALAAVVLGGLALLLLSESNRFYVSFADRHRRLRLLQFADPSPKVPSGPTPLRRLLRHLLQTNPRIAAYLADHPTALRYRTRAGAGAGPSEVAFSIVAPSDRSYRWLGWGDPGFVVLARLAPASLTSADLERFANEAPKVAERLGGPLSRAILLRASASEVAEEVYELSAHRPIVLRGAPPVAVEIISERDDGTYDLIPHILGRP